MRIYFIKFIPFSVDAVMDTMLSPQRVIAKDVKVRYATLISMEECIGFKQAQLNSMHSKVIKTKGWLSKKGMNLEAIAR